MQVFEIVLRVTVNTTDPISQAEMILDMQDFVSDWDGGSAEVVAVKEEN